MPHLTLEYTDNLDFEVQRAAKEKPTGRPTGAKPH